MLLVLLVGCTDDGSKKGSSGGEAAAPAVPTTELPSTRDGFLARLIPLPAGQAVRIVYEVKGPGGLEGSLEVMARPGGFRRENWTLQRPNVEGENTQLRGSTVQTPERLWSAMEGEAESVWTQSPLAALGDAYLALDPPTQARAIESLDRWHADLAAARAEHPGDVQEVASTPCLRLKIAAQTLCLWEQTGLPLRYSGSEFIVEATRVESGAEVTDEAFAIDPEALAQAKRVELPERFHFDPKRSMQSLVDGNYAGLSLVLTPGLRLPLPDTDGEW